MESSPYHGEGPDQPVCRVAYLGTRIIFEEGINFSVFMSIIIAWSVETDLRETFMVQDSIEAVRSCLCGGVVWSKRLFTY
jgi:hypothetical protein